VKPAARFAATRSKRHAGRHPARSCNAIVVMTVFTIGPSAKHQIRSSGTPCAPRYASASFVAISASPAITRITDSSWNLIVRFMRASGTTPPVITTSRTPYAAIKLAMIGCSNNVATSGRAAAATIRTPPADARFSQNTESSSAESPSRTSTAPNPIPPSRSRIGNTAIARVAPKSAVETHSRMHSSVEIKSRMPSAPLAAATHAVLRATVDRSTTPRYATALTDGRDPAIFWFSQRSLPL